MELQRTGRNYDNPFSAERVLQVLEDAGLISAQQRDEIWKKRGAVQRKLERDLIRRRGSHPGRAGVIRSMNIIDVIVVLKLRRADDPSVRREIIAMAARVEEVFNEVRQLLPADPWLMFAEADLCVERGDVSLASEKRAAALALLLKQAETAPEAILQEISDILEYPGNVAVFHGFTLWYSGQFFP